MAYQYDVYLSYPRQGVIAHWISEFFLPLLQLNLDTELERSPDIFSTARVWRSAASGRHTFKAPLHNRDA